MPINFGGLPKDLYVRKMFSTIAHRYDLMNTLLSLNQDRFWREQTVRHMGLKPGCHSLDVACGTGMLTMEQAHKVGIQGGVVGLDFCHEMLVVAEKLIGESAYKGVIELVEGDALALPFPDDTFDAVSIGFALRNVTDIPATIAEMARVVRPGGRVVSLEISRPYLPGFKQAYNLYFNHILPIIGKLGAGVDGPYSYLPNSMRFLPGAEEVRHIFSNCGLADARVYPLTGGIVSIHVGTVA